MKFINLYTKDLSSKRLPENLYFNILLLGSCAISLIYLLLILLNVINFSYIKNQNKKLENNKQLLLLQEQNYNRMVSSLSRLRSDKKALNDIIVTVEGLSKNNIKWSLFLNKLSSYMNTNIWFDSFSTNLVSGYSTDADIHINGGSLSLESLNIFIGKLEKEFGDVKISLRENKNDKIKFSYYSFSLAFIYREKQ